MPAKNAQLMAKDQDLSFEASPRLEPSRNYSKKQADTVKHHLEAYRTKSVCLRWLQSTAGTTLRGLPHPYPRMSFR